MIHIDEVPSEILSGVAKEISPYYYIELCSGLELDAEEWQERLNGDKTIFTETVKDMLTHWSETKDNATKKTLRDVFLRIGLKRLAEKYLSLGDQ